MPATGTADMCPQRQCRNQEPIMFKHMLDVSSDYSYDAFIRAGVLVFATL
jgi:hypothetical protein